MLRMLAFSWSEELKVFSGDVRGGMEADDLRVDLTYNQKRREFEVERERMKLDLEALTCEV